MTPGFFKTAWIIARKDLVVEARSRELIYTTVFFAVAVVLSSRSASSSRGCR